MTGDVARGVRLGTILLVGVLAVFVCYRAVDSVPASGVPDAPEAKVPAPAQTPIVPDAPVKSMTPASQSVPPPPPVSDSGPVIHRHPPRPRPAPAAQQTILATAPAEFSPIETPPAPVAAAPPAPVEVTARKDNSAVPDESGLDDPSPKAPGRGKRLIKAVGRFLKINHDHPVDAQSLRQ